MTDARIEPFARFYPYYLGEHRHPACRALHYVGSWLVLALVLSAIVLRRPLLLAGAPIAGYGFAWIGHLLFEKNRPATFRQPLYSLAGDWLMWWQITRGRLPITERRADKSRT